MATPTVELIQALRDTATRLRRGAHYAWGHHGACNCGNLLQTITQLSEGEILRYAHTGIGEWTELAEEFCPVTQAPVTLLIKKLEEIGLTPTDIHHIEYLDDKAVLQNLEGGFRWLKRNKKEDAIAYFEAFANMLEEKLLQSVHVNTAELLQQETMATTI
ncbi:MAG TPA: hypothetical protein PKC39_07945 [Ferruginibacter sp.]|nr:hypothetical protein [Ferruginibacter sp.]HMP20875.1 hypothetical protein [Ferruginibacter sp.]